MAKYLNPKNDLTFKRIFENKEQAISLLNSFLPFAEENQIKEIEYLTPEQIPDTPAKKYSIVDVKCKDSQGRYFIVETQTYWNNSYFMRAVYNTAKTYTTQMSKSETYNKLKSVYSLNIVNDNAFPEYKDNDEYIQEYYLINKNHSEEIHEDIGLIFIELPKYKPVNSNEKKMKDLWMEFFTQINEDTKEPNNDLLQNPIIAKAIEIVKQSAYNDAELEYYNNAKLDEYIYSQTLENERKEGIEKVAKKMKSKNYDINEIIEITGLSESEIEKL